MICEREHYAILNYFKNKIVEISNRVYDIMKSNLSFLIILFVFLSIIFGVIRTVFFTGYNVDSYQFYALAIKRYILTGETDYVFNHYYARTRIVYPLIIALIYIIIPFNISILACFINLFFLIGCIVVLKYLLKLYDLQTQQINLFILFFACSYNLMNFSFNILTDYTALFFFLLSFVFLKKFELQRNWFFLSYSFFFFFFSFMSRELYIIGFIIYFSLIKNLKIRCLALSILTLCTIVLVYLFTDQLTPIARHFIAPAHFEHYQNQEFIQLFFSLQSRWGFEGYLFSFLKGLVKVGILTSTILILIFYVFKYKALNLKRLFQKYDSFNIWLFFFFVIYTFLYSNINSPSGLRYWLPISWIPLIYLSDIVYRIKKEKLIALLSIFFICLYPFAWSIGELYVNRNVATGTGPIFQEYIYYNGMSDIKTISNYDTKYVSANIVNGTLLNTTSKARAYEDGNAHDLSIVFLRLWLNVSSTLQITVRLSSPNNASWGIKLYQTNTDFSPGRGKLIYSMVNESISKDFSIYKFEIEIQVLIRYVGLTIGGGEDCRIFWDYVKIEAIP